MRTFGLIGFPLTHSFSKKYFTEKFHQENIPDCRYELYPLEKLDALPALLRADTSLCGLNVTIPYKVDILPMLHSMDSAARAIGAVNCISIDAQQYLHGYNTDAIGFEKSLQPLLRPWHSKALILGSGGAAQAVKFTLTNLGIPYKIVSRTAGDLGYDAVDADVLREHTLVINTTPLGMHPAIETFPGLPYQFFTEEHLAYDLVYNPQETTFLKKAAAMGAVIKNGLEMLHLQAEAAWKIWNKET